MSISSPPIGIEYPRDGPLRDVAEDERAAFERDGAHILRGVIPAAWVDFLRETVDRLLARPDASSLDYAKGTGARFYTQTWAWLLDDGLKAFDFFGPCREIAAQVLAPTGHLNLLMDQVFVKEAGATAGTPFHQDEPYGPYSGEGNLRLWVPLDEVTAGSGAVHYLKGSHRWGRLFTPVRFMNPEAPEEGSPFEDPPDFAADYDRYEWLVGACEPGDAILHHARTVHGGWPNTTTGPRRAVTVNYASDRVRYEPKANPLTRSRHRDIASHVRFPKLTAGGPIDSDLHPRVWP